MLNIIVIATLPCGFVNACLLRYVRLSKSTKMRERTVEMYVAAILLINYEEIIKT